MDQNELKRQAAAAAVQFVKPGMVVGLGSGSTAKLAVERIGQLIHEGRLAEIVGIPASTWIAEEAKHRGIPLSTLEAHPSIDLTIDGADEVGPELNLIKGGGGALLREKLIALASRRTIIIVDSSKRVPKLGSRWPVPIEVVAFGWNLQQEYLLSLGATKVTRRLGHDRAVFYTDNGNNILDATFGPIDDPPHLALAIKAQTGIVEHGLFIGIATDVIVAGEDSIEHLQIGAQNGKELQP
ncbi:MAG: ribose-5-phosphate isomerase RpiA [Chloroflexi bacterium]|nr:ribose-5-phosphate isomerase RpiA [Chloroflexota bacterium]